MTSKTPTTTSTTKSSDIDLVCVGCPHCSIKEIAQIADLVKGKKVADNTEFWVATSRSAKQLADKRGYTQTIEAAGGKFACDTCMAVAPLKGRFKALATNVSKRMLLLTAEPYENQNGKHGRMLQCGGDWKMEQLKGRIILQRKSRSRSSKNDTAHLILWRSGPKHWCRHRERT